MPDPATFTRLDVILAELTGLGLGAGAPVGTHILRIAGEAEEAAREISREIVIDSGDGGLLAEAYRERVRLLAVLLAVTQWPASLEEADPSPGFRYVLYVDSPQKQLSWHIADADLDLLEGVERNAGRTWDRSDKATVSGRLESLACGRPLVNDLAGALIWASGSPSFGEGGEAETGWANTARPSLERWRRECLPS